MERLIHMIHTARLAAHFSGLLFVCLLPALSHSATVTTLYNFAGSSTNPRFPTSMTGAGGVLYGVAEEGVFSLTPPTTAGLPWTESTLYKFKGGSDGVSPVSVVMGPSGVLYGVTNKGGTSNYGTVFSLTPPAVSGGAWTHTVLLDLSGSDGAWARGVTVGGGGILYCVAEYGGVLVEGGSIFSLTPPTSNGERWTETVLYEFAGGTEGLSPYAPVVIGSGGVLYGTALAATGGDIVIFSLTPPQIPGGSWIYAVLGGTSGASVGALVIGPGGVLYGTSTYKGTYDDGTVFSVAPPLNPGGPWTATTLYSFMGGTDGASPESNLVFGSNGVLYGVTPYGGNASSTFLGNGTIFGLTPPAESGGSWTEAVLYTFTGGTTGGYPGGLVTTTTSKFYGFAESGDGDSNGSVFVFKP
jgi:hypothetical protein